MSQKKLPNRVQKRRLRTLLIGVSMFMVIVLITALTSVYIALARLGQIMRPVPVAVVKSSYVAEVDLPGILKDALTQKRIAYEKVSQSKDGYFVITTPEKAEIIFSKEKDIAGQISSLQVIVTRLTMEGKRFSRLDLRFDKPVIVLK